MKGWIKMRKKIFAAALSGMMALSMSINVNAVNYVPEYDVNHDNVVAASDLAYMSKILTGKAKPTSIDNLDVNGNGIVDEIDVRTVLYYILGLTTTTTMQ